MGDVVNLNKFRKGKARQARKQLAAVNRHKFARPKAELVKLDAQRGKQAAALDAHRLEESDDSVVGDSGDDRGDDRPGRPRETD